MSEALMEMLDENNVDDYNDSKEVDGAFIG
jgi:hypothetical protein